jgi:YD repeat-containing protein
LAAIEDHLTGTRSFDLDPVGRVTAVTTPDGTEWCYRYDPLGRRTAKQRLAADGTTVAEHVDVTWDGTTLIEQTTTTWPTSSTAHTATTTPPPPATPPPTPSAFPRTSWVPPGPQLSCVIPLAW